MELTKQRLVLITTGTVLVIGFGLYLFLYGPLISKVTAVRLECKLIESEVLQARERVASLKVRGLTRGLITEQEISLAIDELTRQSKLMGVKFVSMAPKQVEEQETKYTILPIDMEIESTYENLGIFLGSLDELEKSIVSVRNFSITHDDAESPNLHAKLIMNLYLTE